VTVKDQDGRMIFSKKKVYHVGDLYFKGGKKVPMAEWDVTATEHFDLGLKSLETDAMTFLVPLNNKTKTVRVEANFRYLYSREKTFPVKDIVKNVVIE
jgi:hypothetical protein